MAWWLAEMGWRQAGRQRACHSGQSAAAWVRAVRLTRAALRLWAVAAQTGQPSGSRPRLEQLLHRACVQPTRAGSGHRRAADNPHFSAPRRPALAARAWPRPTQPALAPPCHLQIRIRGINDVAPKTRKILQLLRLRQINMGVFLKVRRPANSSHQGVSVRRGSCRAARTMAPRAAAPPALCSCCPHAQTAPRLAAPTPSLRAPPPTPHPTPPWSR